MAKKPAKGKKGSKGMPPWLSGGAPTGGMGKGKKPGKKKPGM